MKNNKPRKRHSFMEYLSDIVHISWFIIYHICKGIVYLCVAPIRALNCGCRYHKSAFHKLTGINKKDFNGGSSWEIGNDPRYILCNAVDRMKLPLEFVSVEEPSDARESLMYYYIYKDTVIITHGFYRAIPLDSRDEYYIVRNHFEDEEEYDKMYSLATFREMNWEKFIRPEHKHLPMKILHTNSRYRFQRIKTDKYDSYENGVYYRRIRNLKKVFKQV